MRTLKLSELSEEEKKILQNWANTQIENNKSNNLNETNTTNNTANRLNRNGFTARDDFKNNERVKNAKVVKSDNKINLPGIGKAAWNTYWDTVGYLGKEAGVGALGAVAGLQDEAAIRSAAAIEEGQRGQISNPVSVIANSPSINPLGFGVKYATNIINKIANGDFQKQGVGKTILQGVASATDSLTGWDMVKPALQTLGKTNEAEEIKNNILNSSQWYKDINNQMLETRSKQAPIMQTLGEGASSVGRMLPTIALSAATKNPNLGLTTMAVSAAGTSSREAVDKGLDLETAKGVGDIKGYLEYATEQLFGGDYFSAQAGRNAAKAGTQALKKYSVDDAVKKLVSEKVESKVGQLLWSKGYELGGEVMEEWISDTLGNFVDLAATGEYPGVEELLQNGGKTAVSTFLSTLMLNALGLGGGTYQEIQQLNLNKQQQTEINKLVEEITEKVNPRQQAEQEIQNSKLDNTNKQEMLSALNNMQEVTDQDVQDIKNNINEINKVVDEQNKLPTNGNYKYDNTRKQTYAKYKNDTNTYDSTAVNEVLDTVPTNKNGKRTVAQWKDAATQIGERIANLSNEEIEKIAYKSWFDVQPSKSITRYDNVDKKNVGFSPLNSDTWVNNIYDGVNKARENSVQTQVQEEVKLPMAEKYSQTQTKLNFLESAQNNNIDVNSEDIQSINRMLSERGIDGRFDNTMFDNDSIPAVYLPSSREVIFNPNTKTERTIQFTTVHEMWHDFEGSETANQIKNLILDYDKTKSGYQAARNSLADLYSKVYDSKAANFNDLVDNEAVADILGSELGSQDFIEHLTTQNRTLSQKVYDWVVDKLNKLNKLTGYKSEKIFWADVKNKFENEFKKEYQENNNKNSLFEIITEGNKKYVKASRQVISGNDPLVWETQVEDYINNSIRNGQDVQVVTDDGDILTITKDTAGKAKFRNEIIDKNGNKRKLNNKEFMSKLRAETHIDELAEISKHKQGPVPDTKNHSFAKDGFTYRNAYFEDADGSYYKITMSVGKNGDINTIYNIGKMQNWQKNRRHSISELKGSSGKTTSDRISSNNIVPSSNENVNTTKYSMQENAKYTQDNQGRSLTKEVQNYFKNSQARNDNGELETVYHGTNKAGFTEFNRNFNYFTNNKEVAQSYTGGTEMVDTKRLESVSDAKSWLKGITDELYINNNTVYDYDGEQLLSYNTEAELLRKLKRDIQKEIGNTEAGGTYEGYVNITKPVIVDAKGDKWSMIGIDGITIDGVDNIEQFLKDNGSSVWKEQGKLRTTPNDIVSAVMEAIENGQIDADGVIIKNVYDEGGYGSTTPHALGTDYITFNSNQFKALDNTNPTFDSDIRYSVTENKNIQDNQGRTLSKQQQEYFKDSKVRDENGNLLTMYHSTNADFNTFTYDNLGKNGLAYGSGFYFTDNENAKNAYGENTKTVYLDVKKPMEIGKRTITENDYRKLVNAVNDVTNGQVEADYGSIDDAVQDYQYGGDDIDLVNGLKNESGLSNNKFYELLRNTLGYDGIKANNKTNGQDGNYWIVFNANQIKNIDNTTPTSNPDIRYSSDKNSSWQEYLNKNYAGNGKGKTIQELKLPTQETAKLPTKQEIVKQEPIKQVQESSNEGSNILPVDENAKQRKHYKTVSETQQLSKETRKNASELYEKSTYVPISNTKTLTEANETIRRNGLDRTYESFMSKLNSNERIRLQDIAIGERLIQIYDSMGDTAKAKELTYNVGILGTEIGQITQALSLIKRMSPEGQLVYLQKVVERLNAKENTDIKVSDEMAEKILNSKDQKDLENNMSKVALEIANEMPVKFSDKLRSWRYLSMLGNPRTHIRNIGANIAMNLTQNVKNKVAGAGEDIVGTFKDFERTKTLKPANKDQRSFAKQDASVMQDMIDGGGKYDVKNIIQQNKKQFDNKVLNTIAEFNTNALDWEDKKFLRLAYKQAMQNYMAANKLSSSDMTGKTLEKARQYASLQAQEATFHQFNAIANAISNLENKNTAFKVGVGAILPFKKTPANIAKTGIEYSPVNIARSVLGSIKDITSTTKNLKSQLEKGNISQEEYHTETSKLVTDRIDQMAKGLTGTSIALIGYALAKSGKIRAGNDGKDDEFEEKLGNQEYSVKIGDYTFTLDWLSPAAIPLFVGATVAQMTEAKDETDVDSGLNSLMTGMSKAFEPMTEMSMLQGLTNAISSYEQDSSSKIFDLAASMGQSYLGQYIPTALGQITKTIDPNVRDTSSTKKGLEKKVEQFVNQTKSKIPGLSYTLPTKTDVWGNDKVREGDAIERYINNAIVPYNREKLKNDKVSDELVKLYDNTGETSVLPSTVNKQLTIDKQKYTMTSKELAEYKKQYGEESYELLNKLVNDKAYSKLTDEQKQKAIEKIYDYAKESVKLDYAKESKLPLSESTLTKTVNTMKNKADYFTYLGLTQDATKDSEKQKILANSDIPKSSKESIYENDLGSKDTQYGVMKDTGIDIDKYLNYKVNTSNQLKNDVVNYVSDMDITHNQKLLLLGMNYALTTSEKGQLVNYVQNLNISPARQLEILGKIKGITVHDNGRVTWK